MTYSNELLDNAISTNRIIWIMSDDDADILLMLAKRHLQAAKQLIGLIDQTMGKEALEAEIETCRRERELILEKYC